MSPGRKWHSHRDHDTGGDQYREDAEASGAAPIEFAGGEGGVEDNGQGGGNPEGTGSSGADSAASDSGEGTSSGGRRWTTANDAAGHTRQPDTTDSRTPQPDTPQPDTPQSTRTGEQSTQTGRSWITSGEPSSPRRSSSGEQGPSSDEPASGRSARTASRPQTPDDDSHRQDQPTTGSVWHTGSPSTEQQRSQESGSAEPSEQQTTVNTTVLGAEQARQAREETTAQPAKHSEGAEGADRADGGDREPDERGPEDEPEEGGQQSRAAAVGTSIRDGLSGLRHRIGRSGKGPLDPEAVEEAAAESKDDDGAAQSPDTPDNGADEQPVEAPAKKYGLLSRLMDPGGWRKAKALQTQSGSEVEQQDNTFNHAGGGSEAGAAGEAPGGSMNPNDRMRRMASEIHSGERAPDAARREEEEKEKEGLTERGPFIWCLDHWPVFVAPVLLLAVSAFVLSTMMAGGPSEDELASSSGGPSQAESDDPGNNPAKDSGKGSGGEDGQGEGSGEQIPLYDSGLSFEFSDKDDATLKAGELSWEAARKEVEGAGGDPVEVLQLAGPTAAEVSPAYEMAAAEGEPAKVTTTTFAVESEGSPDIRGTHETFSGQSAEGELTAPNGTYSVTEDSGNLIAEGTYSDKRTGEGQEVIRTYTENVPGREEPREFRVRYEAPEDAPIPLLVGWQRPPGEEA